MRPAGGPCEEAGGVRSVSAEQKAGRVDIEEEGAEVGGTVGGRVQLGG